MILPKEYEKLSPEDAIVLQMEMRKSINITPLNKDFKLIGGADISFNKYEEQVYAGIIVLAYPSMKIGSQVTVKAFTKFPNISGLLALRETPALLKAWEQLKQKPDVLILDDQGIAHERGITTHFGLLTNIPTIGCAKSKLYGNYHQLENERFSASPLLKQEETRGFVLRTKVNCKPIYISPGHKISIAQSLEIIKNCSLKHRIPEPLDWLIY
ncbi:endonuclease V [Pedobacter arcticus]|uniref:endonuclease V n=1 Tax=Pedobacter arcticus TaxID=752140 RepID=UPI0002FB9E7E|nr:endonuclease V [Pedobacter arcticus]